ncbi:MAG: CoA pyrophosphatase [Thaumarchaeota archaeon S13]|nr:MAG: CoA pyrophosphatase [Thaumarchaeota archaeon S13]
MDIELLRRALSTSIDAAVRDGPRSPAAVLLTFYGPGEPTVIMTVKARHMRQHAGEVAFPGGKWEDGDADLLETAMREAREELGLEIARADVIGQLGDAETQSSGYVIAPFVHVLGERPDLLPNAEVEEVLEIPLAAILSTASVSGQLGVTLTHGPHTVWGASARMLTEVGERLRAAGGSLT